LSESGGGVEDSRKGHGHNNTLSDQEEISTKGGKLFWKLWAAKIDRRMIDRSGSNLPTLIDQIYLELSKGRREKGCVKEAC